MLLKIIILCDIVLRIPYDVEQMHLPHFIEPDSTYLRTQSFDVNFNT